MEAAVNVNHRTDVNLQRHFLCRFVFAFIFIFLIYYLYSNTLVHQLRSPVMKFPYVDITYWIFHWLKIPEFVTYNYITSFSFDLMLFASCILSFFFPARRIFIVLFFALFFVYYIVFNSYGGHHTHSKIGILLIPLPFFFSGNRFAYLWEAMRYFALFVYADAFLWKLVRGSFLTVDHSVLVLKKNFAPYLLFNPGTFFSDFYSWLLLHPSFLHGLFITGLIAEGCFIIGFFTRRFDKYLFLLSILMPIGFYLFSDAFFFEILVLSFTLIPFRHLSLNTVSAV